MAKYTLHLELEEVFTCEHTVEADSYEEAVEKAQKIELENGVGSEDTSRFDWDYNRTNFFIDPFGREEKYNEHG